MLMWFSLLLLLVVIQILQPCVYNFIQLSDYFFRYFFAVSSSFWGFSYALTSSLDIVSQLANSLFIPVLPWYLFCVSCCEVLLLHLASTVSVVILPRVIFHFRYCVFIPTSWICIFSYFPHQLILKVDFFLLSHTYEVYLLWLVSILDFY